MSDVNQADAFKTLDAGMLAGILARTTAGKKEREDARASKGGGGGGYVPTGYLQEGKSKIRIFMDPVGNLFRGVDVFTLNESRKKVMDPRFWIKGVDSEGNVVPEEIVQKTWSLIKGLTWQDKNSYKCLCYVQVLETDKPHEKFWTAGNTYLLAANGKFEEALLQQLGALMEGCADDMADSLNPMKEGWAWTIQVVKGSQGTVTLTPTVGKKFPALAELPKGYKDLYQTFVGTTYVEEDVLSLFDQLQAIRDEKGLDVKEGEEKAPAENNGPELPKKEEGAGSSEGASSGNKYGLTPEQLTAAKAMGKTDVEFAALVMGNEQAKADLAAASTSKEEEKAAEDGEHNQWGLTPEQVAAANAAQIPLEQFAKMMK